MKVQNISNSKLTNSNTTKQNQYRNRNKQFTIDFDKLVDIEFDKLVGDDNELRQDNRKPYKFTKGGI
jgi:hypothetical protein